MTHASPTPRSHTRRLALLAVPVALGVLAAVLAESAAQPADAVSLQAAREALDAGKVVLIDIREPNEHARGVAAGAKLLPMSQLRQRVAEIPNDPSTPVLLICNTQNRSSATLKALRQQGYGNVRFVEGGMAEWVRRGWPVVAPGS